MSTACARICLRKPQIPYLDDAPQMLLSIWLTVGLYVRRETQVLTNFANAFWVMTMTIIMVASDDSDDDVVDVVEVDHHCPCRGRHAAQLLHGQSVHNPLVRNLLSQILPLRQEGSRQTKHARARGNMDAPPHSHFAFARVRRVYTRCKSYAGASTLTDSLRRAVKIRQCIWASSPAA